MENEITALTDNLENTDDQPMLIDQHAPKRQNGKKKKASMEDLDVMRKYTIQLPERYCQALDVKAVSVKSSGITELIVKALSKPLARQLQFVTETYAEENGIKLDESGK